MSAVTGQALGPWTVDAVDPARMVSFARVLDDPNPIHLDRAAVAALGLGDRLINQGPLNYGYLIAMLTQALPAARLTRLNVRLGGNVVEGDRLLAAGEVTSTDGDRIECRVWLDVDGGRRVLEGTATLIEEGR